MVFDWQRIQDLFAAALEQPVNARSAFLDDACGGDSKFRDQVDSLLLVHDQTSDLDNIPTSWLGVLARPEQPRLAGEVIAGRYRIESLLGRGGMSEVYEAWDSELSIGVALKMLNMAAGAERALQRLKLEGLLARSVSHSNVCRVYDLGRHDDGKQTLWFLTMEILRGETLSERLQQRGRLPQEEGQRLAAQMAAGLGAAHHAGIVHRDFKPSNVMLVGDAGRELAVVTDFGVARALSVQANGPEPGQVILGTPAYMAPEQALGEDVGPKADIYALGLVLYEMATGQLPFVGAGLEMARRRITEPAPSPRKILPEIDSRWESVILRCLEREPRQRFARAEDVADALAGRLVVESTPELGPAAHNLPRERDAFIGREADISDLARDLAGDTRLLTLLGTGGMGKTRLAIRHGWQSLDRWPGGVWFCDLTEARDLPAIASTVATALGIPLGPGDPIEHLGRGIAARGRCLLILDNFEQIAEYAPETVGEVARSSDRSAISGH